MPRLRYREIPKANVPDTEIVAGQVIFCPDTGECFYDNANTIRILSDYILPVNNISAVSIPQQNRLYIDRQAYVDSTGIIRFHGPEYATLYIYNRIGNWQQVTETSEVNSFLSAYTEVEPAVLEENGKNKAPVTLAKYVFTDTGDNLDDLTKEIKVLKMQVQEIISDSSEITTFQLLPPYDEYFKYPERNFSIFFVNGMVLPMSMYKILSGNKLELLNRIMHEGDVITIVYIFQADLNTSDSRTAGYTDGHYILNQTIPLAKMANVTHSYNTDDDSAIPSAKALHDAHRDLLQKINNLDSSTIIYAADSSSNNYEIVLFIRRYTPTDNNTITLRTRYDLGSDCELRINDFEPVPIYTGIDTPIKDGQVKANTIITLRYNAQQNIFYLINPDIYNVVRDRAVFTLDGVYNRGPMVTIPVELTNFIPGVDCIQVYYQNIRLFEGINYHLNGTNIVLDGFYANDGDVFVIERYRVTASNL